MPRKGCKASCEVIWVGQKERVAATAFRVGLLRVRGAISKGNTGAVSLGHTAIAQVKLTAFGTGKLRIGIDGLLVVSMTGCSLPIGQRELVFAVEPSGDWT